jgi:hypothetical protein
MGKYWFKNEYWGDDWQEHLERAFDAEHAARQVAETSYHDDPCDPDAFEFKVSIKDERDVVTDFIVTAEPDVNFHANEVTA